MSAAGQSPNAPDFVRAMGPVARALLGEPSEEIKAKRELRFGTRGSLSVSLDKGTWHDHEAGKGGGVLDLVRERKALDQAGAVAWLRDQGHLPKAEKPPTQRKRQIAAYDYTSADGELLFQVCRFEPKDFRQRRPDGNGGWAWSMAGVQRVLYRLPEVASAVQAGRTVYVTEGEKAANALAALGVAATCSPGGANKWRAEYSKPLAGADVVLLADNDEPGRQHVAACAKALQGIAGSIRTLDLPGLPPKGDVADWIAAGGTLAAFEALTPGPVAAQDQPKEAQAGADADMAHDAGETPSQDDKAGPDRSHSRRAFRAMARQVRAGATFAQARTDLLEDPETSDWAWKRGVPNGDRELRRMWDRATARHAGGGANRPTIRIAANSLTAMTDEAEKALLAADLGLYQRGEFIVRTGIVRINVSDDRTVMGQRILQLGEAALMEAMDRAASWEKFDSRGDEWLPADPPTKVVKVYLDRVGRWRLPVLTGIINAPTLRPDGSILATPGYDPTTGLLFDPRGATFPTLPDRPTQRQACEALQLLGDLIADFPFISDADRSVALAAMLTACIRRSLPTAPLHGYTAPTAGSGKTKLAELCSILATGREAGVIAQGASEEETEKRLGALLLAGEATILIDNCTDPLAGDFICQMLSQSTVRTRILGLSKTPELPSDALVLATGNNLTIAGDMTRRALLCHLDPQCERPELRSFDSDPIEVMKAHRGRYVAAALTVLRAYHVAGRPMKTTPLGSFEGWSRWVRDALLWLGKPDPVETMEQIRKADPELEALSNVLAQWREVIGPHEKVTVRDIIERATRSTTDAFGRSTFTAPDFREALLTTAGAGGAVNSLKLGKWLAAHKDRIVDGCRIVRTGVSAGRPTWQLHLDRRGANHAA